MNADLQADPAKISSFFNELEIGQDDPSDLELLIEAERRGLLDHVCTVMLFEARKRGLVPPRADFGDEQGIFSARYLGFVVLPSGLERRAQGQSVTNAVVKLLQNEDGRPQPQCDLHISGEGIKMFYVEGVTQPDDVAHWHTIPSLKLCATYDKVLVTVVRGVQHGRELALLHAYKCKDRKKAQESTDLLNRICARVHSARQNPVRRTSAVTRAVVLTKPAEGGYGFNFIGPSSVADTLTGIFITKIRAGTPAAACPQMQEGMQILMINNVDVEEATLAECRELLRDAKQLSMLLQENPLGFAAYQARAGVSRPAVNFQGTRGTQELEEQLDTVFADLVSLSTDMSFHHPIRTVAGKAIFNV